MTAAQIRSTFLSFFESKGHTIVPSAPIVIKNDPTLLFTNAGMNQFKDYFLGNKVAVNKRVVDTQKCLRVSGKHNDLEEVGVDTYHHTMFEMLGNWSFGDYFKKEAIAWSWELLTEVYGLDKNRIYVTVFEGDAKENLPFDQESYDEWAKHIDTKRILKGNKKDNFWEMGDVGPCGPCTEIHIDCRTQEERDTVEGDTLVNADHPQVIEIWNNVFIQFNRLKNGNLENLPEKHVDTGMGFERLVRVMQHKNSNYDTDIFSATIHLTEKIVGKIYDGSDTKQAIAFRVIADHIRAISFTIADSQLPASNGAGYVIRRILRRAVRYYYSYLDCKTPLLYKLVTPLGKQFEHVFPELLQQNEFITKVIFEEEESFLKTLEKGIKKFEDYFEHQKSLGNQSKLSNIMGTTTAYVMEQIQQQQEQPIVIEGKFAFELNDTYGFPLDLTTLMAQEVNAVVDEAGFLKEMKQQKERSRAATTIDTEDWVIIKEGNTEFVGYNDLLVPTKVLRYRKIKAKGKDNFQIVLEQTPFYAESGGQVGDTGSLQFDDETITVFDTKKENDLIIHFVNQLPVNISNEVIAKVNWEKRLETTYNHSATHLMHAALREVLGDHVQQKGSLVSDEILRFDFSHFTKVGDEELRKVMEIVNSKIRENIPVVIKEMDKEEAISLGAMALFGEKYGDKVRVVIMDPKYSVELCGGTHIENTGMIGVFAIISESSVASGVRRIEALTGPKALRHLADKVSENNTINNLLKSKNPLKAIEKLIEDKTQLEKKVEALIAKQINQLAKSLVNKSNLIAVASVNQKPIEAHILIEKVNIDSVDELKKLATSFKQHWNSYIIGLTAIFQDKLHVAVAISDNLIEHQIFDANKIIKERITPLIQGGGGGQKSLATAAGSNINASDEVLNILHSLFK